ncbi:zinc-binding dehydrogenase [Oceanobacillus longus]|uniref:Zinc-binding dehydrogenase n=1 Tax=Oceanobacillus longus TaxID=930120 RepID=A0ABV8H0W0_9BACI
MLPLEEEQIKSVIEKVYPLEEIEEAHHQMDKGDSYGKIVITIP